MVVLSLNFSEMTHAPSPVIAGRAVEGRSVTPFDIQRGPLGLGRLGPRGGGLSALRSSSARRLSFHEPCYSSHFTPYQ